MLNIFLNTWGNYNEHGADGGEWITLPMDEDELEEKMVAIAKAMGDDDPEYFINDYEWTSNIDLGEVGEMDSITKWNETLNDLDELDKWEQMEVMAAMEAFDYELEEAIDSQRSGCFTFYPDKTLEEVAEDLVAECYMPDSEVAKFLARYFDYEAFARDLGYDGYCETQYGVICE